MQDDDGGHDVDLFNGSDVSTPKPSKKTVHNQTDTEDEDSQIEIIDDKFETPRALKLKSWKSKSRVVISADEEDDAMLGTRSIRQAATPSVTWDQSSRI